MTAWYRIIACKVPVASGSSSRNQAVIHIHAGVLRTIFAATRSDATVTR